MNVSLCQRKEEDILRGNITRPAQIKYLKGSQKEVAIDKEVIKSSAICLCSNEFLDLWPRISPCIMYLIWLNSNCPSEKNIFKLERDYPAVAEFQH